MDKLTIKKAVAAYLGSANTKTAVSIEDLDARDLKSTFADVVKKIKKELGVDSDRSITEFTWDKSEGLYYGLIGLKTKGVDEEFKKQVANILQVSRFFKLCAKTLRPQVDLRVQTDDDDVLEFLVDGNGKWSLDIVK